ncbi:oxysterol binding protein [Mucor ambiguus]|uniref:Oxysterol binding protein n=1 Tax=Mucor ambiguus TaxID=91626 RepID=A0A0C9M1W7_9FUNG|nr:oxysterol binding protein [Mucor ambiguus]
MPHHINDNESNTEELAEGSRSILLNIASQLTKGMDLHRVTLPTFVLEPRSMLERITDFMAHPEFILPISDINDDTQRFIAVVKWFLSGWHIKPKGVKKPFNPVLGEFFRCRYNYQDGTEAFYIAEQVSHHPPASAYFYTCPQHQVVITGDLKPKSRFYGNSVASLMQGTINFILPSRHNELYQVKMPNMYARGVLFGTMTLELGDSSTVRCASSDLICEMDFQTKGFFSGQPNSVVGKIKRESTQEILYEISGQWSGELFIKKYTPPEKSSISELLSLTKKSAKEEERPDLMVDVRDYAKYPLLVPEHQEQKESRRLWAKLTEGLLANNQDMATDEKTKVEDEERALRKERKANNIEWKPRFFDVDGDDYKFKGMDKLDFNNPQAICQELSALYQ